MFEVRYLFIGNNIFRIFFQLLNIDVFVLGCLEVYVVREKNGIYILKERYI